MISWYVCISFFSTYKWLSTFKTKEAILTTCKQAGLERASDFQAEGLLDWVQALDKSLSLWQKLPSGALSKVEIGSYLQMNVLVLVMCTADIN